MDDFKGHSRDIVKEYTIGFRNTHDNALRYNLCAFEIVAGGISPIEQPIDAFIGKV